VRVFEIFERAVAQCFNIITEGHGGLDQSAGVVQDRLYGRFVRPTAEMDNGTLGTTV
jgi:hypothetical protein